MIETGTMETGSKTSSIAVELDEMLKLAEASTATVDITLESISRAKIQLIAIALTFLAVFAWFVLHPSESRSWDWLKYGVLLAPVLGGLLHEARHYRNLGRNLQVEFRARARLLSLIDDQHKRLLHENLVTPMAQATVEIRIGRLDRSYWEK